ncbi:hypothetical protein HHI36_012675, partial [Cryptolaemus montrouzieri]
MRIAREEMNVPKLQGVKKTLNDYMKAKKQLEAVEKIKEAEEMGNVGSTSKK